MSVVSLLHNECYNCGDFFDVNDTDHCISCLKTFCFECYDDQNIISRCSDCKEKLCIDCLDFCCKVCNIRFCYECFDDNLRVLSYNWHLIGTVPMWSQMYVCCDNRIRLSSEASFRRECYFNNSLFTCCKCFHKYSKDYADAIQSKQRCLNCIGFDSRTYFELLPNDIFKIISGLV